MGMFSNGILVMIVQFYKFTKIIELYIYLGVYVTVYKLYLIKL